MEMEMRASRGQADGTCGGAGPRDGRPGRGAASRAARTRTRSAAVAAGPGERRCTAREAAAGARDGDPEGAREGAWSDGDVEGEGSGEGPGRRETAPGHRWGLAGWLAGPDSGKSGWADEARMGGGPGQPGRDCVGGIWPRMDWGWPVRGPLQWVFWLEVKSRVEVKAVSFSHSLRRKLKEDREGLGRGPGWGNFWWTWAPERPGGDVWAARMLP